MLLALSLLADDLGSVYLGIQRTYNERLSVDFAVSSSIEVQDRQNGMPIGRRSLNTYMYLCLD